MQQYFLEIELLLLKLDLGHNTSARDGNDSRIWVVLYATHQSIIIRGALLWEGPYCQSLKKEE